jgi:hypothetical protein
MHTSQPVACVAAGIRVKFFCGHQSCLHVDLSLKEPQQHCGASNNFRVYKGATLPQAENAKEQ